MVKKKIEPHEIENKMRRHNVLDKRKIEKKKLRKERRKKVKSGEVEKIDPNTQENMRILTDDIILEKDEDLNEEESFDEFSQFIKSLKTPKIFITSNLKPTRFTFDFLIEIKNLLPNAHYYPRNKQTLPKICKAAQKENFTHLLMINERLKKPWSLSFTILGTGPTLTFRIRKYVPTYQIFNKGNATGHHPELILKNFNTALGRRVARGIGSLFPSSPEFKGRTVVTFHNQRDFIFFRHHRYIFKKKEEAESDKIEDRIKVNLQEIGPRFVLQLQKIYQSNFDEFQGPSEFLYRADYYVKRNKFYLTMIRLQNKYHRNNKTFKIIVQGKNRNLRGDYIEHIGWWLPFGTKSQERSILINKYRARYWISVGSQFSPKIQRCFSFIGMAQAPWISFGSKTLYKESKEIKHKRWKKGLDYFIKKAHNMVQEQKMGDDEIKEIQAQYFRKFKLEENLGSYLNNEIEIDNLLGETKQKTENENDLIRTEKYKVLKKFYDSVEQGKVFIDEHKKQILFDKLKELIEQGVHSQKYQNFSAEIDGKEYHYKDLEQIFRKQYEELKQNRVVKTQLFKQQFVPITQEEAQQLFMKYQRLNLRQATKKTREIFENAKEDNKTVLRFHIIGQIQEEQIRKDIGYAEKEGYENIVIDNVMEPEFSLLTPPDLEEYNPEDCDLTPASKDHSRLLDRPKRRAYLNYKDDIDRESKKLVDTDSKEFQKEIPEAIQYAFHDTFKEELGLKPKNTIF